MRDSIYKVRNGLARLVHGLPVTGGPVSPEAPGDVYQTVRSIYRFAGTVCSGRATLDLLCGTGFGTAELLAAGCSPVVGVDPDGRAIRYARRRFARDGLVFRRDAVNPLPEALPSFTATVAVGALPHLPDPEATLAALAHRMGSEGLLVCALPPILDGPTLEVHRGREPGADHRYLWDWLGALEARFRRLDLYRHLPPADTELDLASPRPSRARPEDFRFEAIPTAELDDVGHLGAVFVATGAAG
ncbi:MAG: class I SAM-dependent methyltransferase [Thermoanaerobaculia bacterium]